MKCCIISAIHSTSAACTVQATHVTWTAERYVWCCHPTGEGGGGGVPLAVQYRVGTALLISLCHSLSCYLTEIVRWRRQDDRHAKALMTCVRGRSPPPVNWLVAVCVSAACANLDHISSPGFIKITASSAKVILIGLLRVEASTVFFY